VLWQKILLGTLRHFLTVSGGGLVATGYLDDAGLQQAIGAIITIVGIAWSVYDKRRVHVPASTVPSTGQGTGTAASGTEVGD
jgi:hypothetical protein